MTRLRNPITCPRGFVDAPSPTNWIHEVLIQPGEVYLCLIHIPSLCFWICCEGGGVQLPTREQTLSMFHGCHSSTGVLSPHPPTTCQSLCPQSHDGNRFWVKKEAPPSIQNQLFKSFQAPFCTSWAGDVPVSNCQMTLNVSVIRSHEEDVTEEWEQCEPTESLVFVRGDSSDTTAIRPQKTWTRKTSVGLWLECE